MKKTVSPYLGLSMLVIAALSCGCNRWIAGPAPTVGNSLFSANTPGGAANGTRLVSAPATEATSDGSESSDRYVARQYPSTPPYVPPTTAPPPSTTLPPSSYSQQPSPYSQQPSTYSQQPSTNYNTPPSLSSPSNNVPNYGGGQNYGSPSAPASPPTVSGEMFPGGGFPNSGLPDSSMPGSGLPSTLYGDPVAPPTTYVPMPTVREADLIINGYPARTGRIMLGGAVNSDAGVTGQITLDERNFDITRWPTSFQDLFSGTAFRGAGQTFRVEAAPGSDFDRYTINFADPNLFGYKPVSMSISGFLVDRRFQDWDEQRLGGKLSFGYRITPDLSVSVGFSGQNVEISNARVPAVTPNGESDLYSGIISLKHDTRNSPIQSSEGHYFDFSFEQAFGDFEYSRFETEYRKYWLLAQRADGSGRQTLSYSNQFGYSGDDTPFFENFFAGGYATLRGFDFRGAGPVESGVSIGGRFKFLNTIEYMFPITADDAFKGVAFVDFGTVEKDIELNSDSFRVSPGVGLRVAIPMLGPAPLAFDFAFPVNKADTDQTQVFSFYMSLVR
ncbi:BamA/OMP85 family outer membrane protein [Novipirellula aureliae]|nr:outer membrane protein assembly factor [Novipirellula aureliae]